MRLHAIGALWQFEFLQGFTGCRVELQTFIRQRQIDRIRKREIVTADLISPRMMSGVTIVMADTLDLTFPQQTPGIDIQSSENVLAFNEDSPTNNLR